MKLIKRSSSRLDEITYLFVVQSNKVKAAAQLSTQKNSPVGVEFQESPREVVSNRRHVSKMMSQTTSVKGSDSHKMVTEQDSLANPNGTFSFNN